MISRNLSFRVTHAESEAVWLKNKMIGPFGYHDHSHAFDKSEEEEELS